MKLKPLAEQTHTDRGFPRIDFTDSYGQRCSLQASSLAEYEPPGTSAVWLGVDFDLKGQELHARMHLKRRQVVSLIGHLAAWLHTGEFIEEDSHGQD